MCIVSILSLDTSYYEIDRDLIQYVESMFQSELDLNMHVNELVMCVCVCILLCVYVIFIMCVLVSSFFLLFFYMYL